MRNNFNDGQVASQFRLDGQSEKANRVYPFDKVPNNVHFSCRYVSPFVCRIRLQISKIKLPSCLATKSKEPEKAVGRIPSKQLARPHVSDNFLREQKIASRKHFFHGC